MPARTFGNNGFRTMRPMVLGLAKLLALPIASAAPLTSAFLESGCLLHARKEEEHGVDGGSLIMYLAVAMALVLLGGVFAGLTIALMGQDETYLQVIASSGEGSERKHAEKVLNLLKKGKHWVLVTLLLSNVITNETLPIVLDRSLGGGWPAVVSSTVLIVIFGEIAPQSVCVRYGLSIGAYMSPFVLALMWLMFPVAWPTAKLLDWLLGEDHGTTYKKAGLKTLVSLHRTIGANTAERLLEDEVNIINSVLDLKEKPVGDIITPMQDVFTMSADTVLDEKMMDTILSQGYSRIPIHTPDNHRNFIGMLLVKILITYDPEDCKRVRDFSLATLPETAPHTSCLDIINFFQEGKSHMVLVSDFPGENKGALGVVTLEDVIEELIGEEIIDESDVFIDIHKAIRRIAPAPKTRFGKQLEYAESDTEQDAKEVGEEEPLLGPESTKRPGIARSLTARRKSSNASDSTREIGRPMHVRGKQADIRQHLKHLGPSNMASKPRATRFTSVKIKPGVGTIPENVATDNAREALIRSQSAENVTTRTTDTETASLLKTDGASDGVAAVQAGYGTVTSSDPSRPFSSDRMSASEASKLAREHTPASPLQQDSSQVSESPKKPDNDRTTSTDYQPPKLVIGSNGQAVDFDAADREGDEDDKDTVGEMRPTRDRSHDHRVARSGSITQTTVEAGGLKKIVLETTSSPDTTGDDNDDADANEEDQEARAANGNGSADASAKENGSEAGKKRKKKRGKRRKGEGEDGA